MKKENYFRNSDELDDSPDEPDDYFGPVLNAPKHSPMRRKERFRTKDFKTEIKLKGCKQNWRSHLKYDFEL